MVDLIGLTMPLAQRALDDTARDLLFDSVGALFGQARLTRVAEPSGPGCSPPERGDAWRVVENVQDGAERAGVDED